MVLEAFSSASNEKDYWRPCGAGNFFQYFGHARQVFYHQAVSTAQIHEPHYCICKALWLLACLIIVNITGEGSIIIFLLTQTYLSYSLGHFPAPGNKDCSFDGCVPKAVSYRAELFSFI